VVARAAKVKPGKVAEFLASYKGFDHKPCKLCGNAQASAALDEIIAARRSGQSMVTLSAVARFLQSEYGVPLSSTFVQYCCASHRGGTWTTHLQRKGLGK